MPGSTTGGVTRTGNQDGASFELVGPRGSIHEPISRYKYSSVCHIIRGAQKAGRTVLVVGIQNGLVGLLEAADVGVADGMEAGEMTKRASNVMIYVTYFSDAKLGRGNPVNLGLIETLQYVAPKSGADV